MARGSERARLIAGLMLGLATDAQAQDTVAGAPALGSPMIVIAVAMTLFAALLALIAWQRRRLSQARQAVRRVEAAFGEFANAGPVKSSEIPAKLAEIRADVELLLSRLDARPPEPHMPAPTPQRILIDAALAAIEAAVEAANAASPSSAALVDHFDLTQHLPAAAASLTAIRDGADPAAAAVNALRTGQLNHLLTMALLLQVYFRDDVAAAALRVNYVAAAAAVDALLHRTGAITHLPAPLSVLSRAQRERDVGFVDRRRIGLITIIRDQAKRVARKLDDSELLIVDCLAPGWRYGGTEQPPTLVGYNPADWMS
jgi:hypothetical protein